MQAVILAGGESSRFWPLNNRHKSLIRIRGKTLIERTLESLRDAGIGTAVIVQGPERDIEDEIGDGPDNLEVIYRIQESPDGMGDALEQAREELDGYFLVTGPYKIKAGEMLQNLEKTREQGGSVAGLETSHPERYGVLELEDGKVTGIVEKPEEGEAPSDLRIVSTYMLHSDFFDELDSVEQHEYSFEDALDSYMEDRDVGFVELEKDRPSLKYPWNVLDFAEELLEEQEPRIADSAEIADSAVIEGEVVIGEDVKVYENSVIRGPVYIGEGCTIGNNALVRSYTNLEENCTVGANMEIRGTVAQEGLSTHSGFIGDSVIGQDVSIGAGTVVANRRVRGNEGERPEISIHVRSKDENVRTGRDRLGVMVGDNVDIGTQANLMPGVCIGKGTFIGPSALVRGNIGEDKKYFTKLEGRELER